MALVYPLAVPRSG